MARFVSAAMMLLTFSQTTYADEGIVVPERVTEAADEASVDPIDLLGAVITTGRDPYDYLYATGELERPVVIPPGWPIGGDMGKRIYCIEWYESKHGLEMYNKNGWPPPYYNEHAQGWLGWLPSTASRWGAIIGNRTSEWAAAAKMIVSNNGGQFYGISAGLC